MRNKIIEEIISDIGNQRKLAEIVGVSQGAVCFWLNGGGIKAKYIPLIAKASNGKVSEMDILNSLTQDGQ